MGGRPTIVDVARLAGVSKSTVSLVLNDSPLVADATRGAVQKAMTELGYVYNRSAAKLRTGNVGLIGLVINDLRNPFFTEFATSAQMAFATHGHATVIANSDEDAAVQEMVVASMIEHGVSALVVSPAYGASGCCARIARAGIPTQTVLRRMEGQGCDFPFASFDYATGSRLATRHLLDTGARRIAFVGGLPDRAVTAERMSGYLAEMQAEGLAPLPLTGRSTRRFGREAAPGLLAQRVDAALCFNDLVALGLQAGVAAQGARLRIIGFDDIEEAAQAQPPLSSVHCDIAGFGRLAAETVLAWLERGVAPPAERRLPVRLVLRASSEAA